MHSPPLYLLVGCGNIAQRHALQMARTGRLVACVDTQLDKAETLAAQYNATAYNSLEAALASADAYTVAAICTPNGVHAAQAIACMRAGLHVLVEKPMAIHPQDALAMMETAHHTGRKLMVVKQNRYNPPVQAVRQLQQAGNLGRLLSVQINCFWNRNAHYYHQSWKGTKELDGGTLYTQFSHFIDLLLWLCGPVEAVLAASAANAQHQHIIEFEDTGLVQLRLQNGALAGIHYSVNSYERNVEGSISLVYEHAFLKIGGPYLNLLEACVLPHGATVELPATDAVANQYPQGYQGTMSNHPLVYDHLLATLQGQAHSSVSAAEGYNTVRLIHHIYQRMNPYAL